MRPMQRGGSVSSTQIQLKTFVVSYQHEGVNLALHVKGASEQDARARLSKLGYGQIDGELVATIPAVQSGRIAKPLVWLRNAFRL